MVDQIYHTKPKVAHLRNRNLTEAQVSEAEGGLRLKTMSPEGRGQGNCGEKKIPRQVSGKMLE